MKPFMKITLIVALVCALVTGGILTGMINPANVNNQENKPSLSGMNATISGEKIHGYVGAFGNITIDSEVTPDSPATFPVYRGVQKEGDSFEKFFQTIGKFRQNVTSPKDADRVARKVMEPYGGIPTDAIFQGADTEYAEQIDLNTHEVEDRWPVVTSVSYTRYINDRWIIGDRNKIDLDLGENDELLYVHKVWRTYTYIGDVPIISLDKAIRKLQDGETMETYLDQKQDVKITVMGIGYYAKNVANNETVLEPIWSFYGSTSKGNPIALNVYARQFANFTATSTSGKVPLAITFTDTSDASPNQWLWDFGDGTNSTEQNPAHTYTTAGTYNISLKAWNDLGSDTMERPLYITVQNPAAPVANFTAAPTSGYKPLTVTFNDTSTNLPTSWQWDFGDDTNATMQNPVHTYSAPGNYSVSLNVTNDDGSNSVTKPDYIKVTNLPPTTLTTAPTTTVTTTTVTTTVTTTTTTTKPTPTRTHAPLSPVVAIGGIMAIGMLHAMRQKKEEE
jgi:PKD repeat protein